MRILAIDPGHTCGIAELTVNQMQVTVVPDSVKCVSPGHVYNLLNTVSPWNAFDVVVIEEFRLYPWLATHQAFSDFKTCEVIGVVKYLTAMNSMALEIQQATIKKEARTLAVEHGWPMKERSLGSGAGKYRGLDFDYPGQQHGRDALAHACYWAWRNPKSPAYQG